MEKETINQTSQNLGGTATHSGWNHFYLLFSKHRDECLKLSQIVFGADTNVSLKYLKPYHSSIYSMAQQVFSFYDSDIEKIITSKWFDLMEEINDILYFISDKDFRKQMILDGKDIIPKKLKTDLLLFFNKIDRLAGEAGLLVGKENKGLSEPKKGLVGF